MVRILSYRLTSCLFTHFVASGVGAGSMALTKEESLGKAGRFAKVTSALPVYIKDVVYEI